MNTESMIPIATSVGGAFFVGAIVGYFLKKIIKLVMFVSGGIVALLLCLQQQEIISVNMERVQNSLIPMLTWIATSVDKFTQIGDTISLGIPISGGLSAGFVIGFMKG